MTTLLDTSGYRAILAVKSALRFDIGAFFMRLYGYMRTIGSVSMMTLAGCSFLDSGIIASVIAFSQFALSPQVARQIDKHGQNKIVPATSAISICGLVILLAAVQGALPFVTAYFGAVLMGFLPAGQSLARARWTYLVQSGLLGRDAPTIKAVYSYEGVIDDVAFMISPAAAVAIAAATIPIAGMAVGGIMCVIGVVLLVSSRNTEPKPGWDKRTDVSESKSAVILSNPIVLVLFVLMFCLGVFYGLFDTATIALAEEVGQPTVSSVALVLESAVSVISGFMFGLLRLQARYSRRLLVVSLLIGCAYGFMAFIETPASLFVIAGIAALFYAPFLITVNEVCEHVTSGNNITEAITWITAGSTCGLALGPTISGFLVDNSGSAASFDVGAIFALAIPVIVILTWPLLKKNERLSRRN